VYSHVLPLGETFTNYVALMWVVIVNMEMNNHISDVLLCH